MGNASVISQMDRAPRELNQGGTGTSAIIFSSDGTNPVLLPLPSASQLAFGSGTTGKSSHFVVKAGGRCTGGTTTNYTVTLYFGTSLTAASNTVIEASTARAINSENENWHIEVHVNWDEVSQKINGWGLSQVSNLYDAAAALDNQVTAAEGDDNDTQGFVVAGTFSSGNASNTSHLDYFQLEL